MQASETPFQPQQGDRVTFRLAMRVRDVRAAQAVGGAAARHAGQNARAALQSAWQSSSTFCHLGCHCRCMTSNPTL